MMRHNSFMVTFFRKIMQICKWTHKILNFFREFLLNMGFLFILVVIISILVINSKNNKSNPIVNNVKNGALVLVLNGEIVEKGISNKPAIYNNQAYNIFKTNNPSSNIISVFEIVRKIRQAKKDPKISGLILDVQSSFLANQVILDYIGKSIIEFKRTKKPVFAIGKNYNQTQYFLSSFADKIFLLPNGFINIEGMGNKKIYFKKLLDFFKVHVHVFRIGKYKSAIEPLICQKASKNSKKIDKIWIRTHWNYFLNGIAKNRKIKRSNIFIRHDSLDKNIIYRTNYNDDQMALKYNLVDYVDSYQNINKRLIKVFGLNKNTHSFNNILFDNYTYINHIKSDVKQQIAVIIANGSIEDSNNTTNIMNLNDIIKSIRNVIANKNIKAVVLRINSPGGDVQNTEKIRKELYKLKVAKKPLIISMGNIAASGGYWIATAGDYIIAHPTTLTGSIGIFSVVQTYEKTLSALGLNYDGVSTEFYKNHKICQNLSRNEKEMIKSSILQEYLKFIHLVSVSRKKPLKDVRKLAQGQIWTGIHAKKNGLIDELGDLDTAIEKAARLSNLKKYNIIWMEQKYKFLQILKKEILDITKHTLYITINKFISHVMNAEVSLLHKNMNYMNTYNQYNA